MSQFRKPSVLPRKQHDRLVLMLLGDWCDISMADKRLVTDAIYQALESNNNPIRLDLTQIGFMDSWAANRICDVVRDTQERNLYIGVAVDCTRTDDYGTLEYVLQERDVKVHFHWESPPQPKFEDPTSTQKFLAELMLLCRRHNAVIAGHTLGDTFHLTVGTYPNDERSEISRISESDTKYTDHNNEKVTAHPPLHGSDFNRVVFQNDKGERADVVSPFDARVPEMTDAEKQDFIDRMNAR